MSSLVLGSITSDLTWDKCKFWVNSLNQSGYSGDKLIIIFGDNRELEQKFEQNNFEVISLRKLEPNEHVCVVRFYVYYAILQDRKEKYDFIITTDVTDVIFQKDPSKYVYFSLIDSISTKHIISSSENIRYKDEVWGANNMRLAFGEEVYEKLKDISIYNAGVMAGKTEAMSDLFFSIYSLCTGKQQHVPGGGGSDQAAYNVLLSTIPYKLITRYVSHDSGWACQVGTVADPYKDYSRVNIEANPKFENGMVKTSSGIDYFIVHQYNRNSMWKQSIEEKYR